jgi:hypothetical protein
MHLKLKILDADPIEYYMVSTRENPPDTLISSIYTVTVTVIS